MSHDGIELPALALLDARRLTQVLARLREHAGGQLSLQARRLRGKVELAFQAGQPDGAWSDVTASLADDRILPGVMVAAHLVRAMGGVAAERRCLRFTMRAPLARKKTRCRRRRISTGPSRSAPATPFCCWSRTSRCRII
jgi:hypothetical protein